MKTIARLGLIRPFLGMLLGGGCALTWVRAAETQESDLIPCLACTGDYQPIAPNASIAAEEKQLFVVFHLAPNEHFKKLVSSWVADDVGAAAPPGYKLGKGELRLEKSRSGQLRYFQSKRLPVGKYHVDVVADGKPWRSATFTVVDPPVLKIGAPSDLMPLTEGQTWTYDFVQEVAPGATLSDSDLKPEADGKLHATVTVTAGKREADGMHVTFMRNATPVTEEWWTLSDKGLSASRRSVGGEQVVLDPPQVLVALPSDGYMDWEYKAADGSFSQRYREWCLNVNAAPGIPAGMLVVTEQDLQPGVRVVAERHWIPGRGLVREVITTTLAGHLLSRQTMRLR